MITLKDIQKNESIQALVHAGNRYLAAMGYTDHGPRHVGYVSKTASYLLRELGYSEREVELAAIAGWVHDVGNSVNRHEHGPNGAVLLYPILREAGMEINDVVEIITAVATTRSRAALCPAPYPPRWRLPTNPTRTKAAFAGVSLIPPIRTTA